MEDAGKHELATQQCWCGRARWHHLCRWWLWWKRLPQLVWGLQPQNRRVEPLCRCLHQFLRARGRGTDRGGGGYLTQTNRLGDVIVLCDVLYVCGRVDGRVFEAWGRGEGGLLYRSHPWWGWLFWESVFGRRWVGVVCLGLLKATLSLCILHTLFLLLYILLFLFFHFKKNANIYCTLNVLFLSSFEILLFFSKLKTGLIGWTH